MAQYNVGTGITSIVDHLKYDSFGNITAQSNSAYQPLFAYTGMQWDSAAGLYYDHARWYDPHLGRFISQDPTSFAAGDVNLYRYVGNGPGNGVDPSGLDAAPIGTNVPAIAFVPPPSGTIGAAGTAVGSGGVVIAPQVIGGADASGLATYAQSVPPPGLIAPPTKAPALTLQPPITRPTDGAVIGTFTGPDGRILLVIVQYPDGTVMFIDHEKNETYIEFPSGRVRRYIGVPREPPVMRPRARPVQGPTAPPPRGYQWWRRHLYFNPVFTIGGGGPHGRNVGFWDGFWPPSGHLYGDGAGFRW